MKKMIVMALMLLMTVINLLPAAAGELNPNWLPAQSKWVIHFDQTLFSQTRLFSILDRNWRDDKKSVQSELLDELDIDIGKDLNGLTVVGLDRFGKGDRVMVVLQGRFDQERIVRRIKQKEKTVASKLVAGFKVLSWDADSHLFFPDRNTIVFCETEGGINGIVDLWKGRAGVMAPTSPLLKILGEAPRNAFVRAAVVDVSELSRLAPKTMVLDSASLAFFMALESRDNLSMMLKLVTESDKKAQNLQQVMTGLKALASLKSLDDDKDSAGWLQLLNGLQINTEGNRLIMNFAYPVDRIATLIDHHQHRKEHSGSATPVKAQADAEDEEED